MAVAVEGAPVGSRLRADGGGDGEVVVHDGVHVRLAARQLHGHGEVEPVLGRAQDVATLAVALGHHGGIVVGRGVVTLGEGEVAVLGHAGKGLAAVRLRRNVDGGKQTVFYDDPPTAPTDHAAIVVARLARQAPVEEAVAQGDGLTIGRIGHEAAVRGIAADRAVHVHRRAARLNLCRGVVGNPSYESSGELLAVDEVALRVQFADGGAPHVAEGGVVRLVQGVLGVEGERMAVAVEGSGVGVGLRADHHERFVAQVDVRCHDGVGGVLSAVHQFGKLLPVLCRAQYHAPLAVLLWAADGKVQGHGVRRFRPGPCAFGGGRSDGGQGQRGGQRGQGIAAALHPVPGGRVHASHAVVDRLALVVLEQVVVGEGVGEPLQVIVRLADVAPVGVGGGTVAAGVALHLPHVVGRNVGPSCPGHRPGEAGTPVRLHLGGQRLCRVQQG